MIRLPALKFYLKSLPRSIFPFAQRLSISSLLSQSSIQPAMLDRLVDVQNTLSNPDEIRLCKNDSQVYLFYRDDGTKRWVCAVARRLNGEGFLITAYRTSAIKEGESIWQR